MEETALLKWHVKKKDFRLIEIALPKHAWDLVESISITFN